MKGISNNIIAYFMVILMIISVVNTLIVSYYAERKMHPTGEATLGGDVGILINGSISEPSPGGGGGGGGGERTPVIHILDFIKKDSYIIESFYNDKYIAIFPKSNYTFTNLGHKDDGVILKIGNFSFSVNISYLVKLDLDLDNIDDLSLVFDRGHITFTALHPPLPTPLPPRISIEKIIEEPGIRFPLGRLNYELLLLIFLVLVVIVIILQIIGLKKFASKEERTALEIYKQYKAELEKKKNNVLDVDKTKVYQDLINQKSLLQKSYIAGNINKEAYLKGRASIDNLLKKL